jgi:phosphoribosylglycinamide formyltransferase-1
MGGTPVRKLRVGVLASGRGSNLQSIIDRSGAGDIDVEVALVISDVEDAEALSRAARAGIPALFLPPGRYRTKLEPEAEDRYAVALEEHGVDVVALAGFMRILGDAFLNRFAGRIVNIHPSLLPSFPGLDAHGQAFRHGVKWTGATVHFVDAGVDTGPIILQAAVPVLDSDTRDTLAARILDEEHSIYPQALQLLAEGRVKVDGRVVKIEAAGSRGGGRVGAGNRGSTDV